MIKKTHSITQMSAEIGWNHHVLSCFMLNIPPSSLHPWRRYSPPSASSAPRCSPCRQRGGSAAAWRPPRLAVHGGSTKVWWVVGWTKPIWKIWKSVGMIIVNDHCLWENLHFFYAIITIFDGKTHNKSLVGGWYTYPSEKMISSVGMMTFPINMQK